MTNSIAIALGSVLVVLALVDIVLFDSQQIVFLGKRLFELIQWLAFWR